jgi:alanine-glyoxylate transaminase/serine-glyoxylate transaminase/serine-pyruvate transaminase
MPKEIPPADRTLLMIPGPTMVRPEVLAAGARPMLSHSDPAFSAIAGAAIARLRELFDTPTAQPVVVAGSGTLAMEIGLANVVEPGDRLLILETGVFGRRFAEIARRLDVDARVEAAPVGQPIQPDQVRRVLQEFRPKVVTITHVDTSTGVRSDLPALARLAHEYDALVVVDGVCSIGGEEYHGDAWHVDLTLTASQKAIGGPPGLAILAVGPRAVAVRKARKAPFPGYFTDLLNWLPVMESYEGGHPAYFGTPAITLIQTLHAALEDAFAEGLANRYTRHQRLGRAFKAGISAIGLEDVAAPEATANTLTAVRTPGIGASNLIQAVHAEGVTISTAIHPDLYGKGFRVGHMGATGTTEVLATLAAIERGLIRIGQSVDLGASLVAAQRRLAEAIRVPVGIA